MAINPNTVKTSLTDSMNEAYSLDDNYFKPTTDFSNGNMDTGLTAPQQQMVGNSIAGAAQVGASVISAAAQGRELERTANEDRKLAQLQHLDDQTQMNVDFSLKKKQQQQEKEQFELQKAQEEFQLRHDRWLADLQDRMARIGDVQSAVQGIGELMKSNETSRDMLLKMFGV